jgi:predicted MPP superfamily phosphohydrolase
MSWFYFSYFTIYSAMNLVVFLRLRPLLPTFRGRWAAVLAFIALVVMAQVFARMAERAGHHPLAWSWAALGYWWMGFCSLCFMTALLSWLLQGGLALARAWTPLDVPAASPRLFAGLALAAALGLTAFGAWEAGHPQIERLALTTDKLPPGRDRLVIVQVSDVHLSILTRQVRLAALTALVAAQKPDLVVSTGDMIDGTLFEHEDLAGSWSALNPPLGKYAITGNHEFYVGVDNAMEYLARCGFTVLRGQTARPGGLLNLAGVDDPTFPGFREQEARALDDRDSSLYTILLKHRPSVEPSSLGRFDLQLSGHTHRGQIFPFNYVTGAVYPMQEGLYRLPSGSSLYTSRGSGTWGPPLRIGSPPEVTVVEIKRREDPATK